MIEENNDGLILSRKIYGCHPDSFSSFTVIGRRRIGKTSYSMRSLHQAFLKMGYTENNAWREVLKSVRFSIPEVISFLEDAIKKDEKAVCLIWDDTRVHGGGGQWFLNMKLVTKLSGMLDEIGTAVSCLILTCPSPKGLLSVLSTYDDYFVKISYHPSKGGFFRVASGYLWVTLPSNQRRVYKKFEDIYSCRLPQWVYDKYMIRRKEALAISIKAVDKIMKEDEEK